MDIEDCEVGMRVKAKENWPDVGIVKNKEYIVDKVKGKKYIKLEGKDCYFNPQCFVPISKFEIGDKVIIKVLDTEVKIWGKRYNEAIGKYQYAVRGHGWNDIYYEDKLLPPKKKNGLEKGDKFKDIDGRKVKVLDWYRDNITGVKYIGKDEDTGYVTIWELDRIDKVIYE